jgi:hypothetical protein
MKRQLHRREQIVVGLRAGLGGGDKVGNPSPDVRFPGKGSDQLIAAVIGGLVEGAQRPVLRLLVVAKRRRADDRRVEGGLGEIQHRPGALVTRQRRRVIRIIRLDPRLQPVEFRAAKGAPPGFRRLSRWSRRRRGFVMLGHGDRRRRIIWRQIAAGEPGQSAAKAHEKRAPH